MQTVRTATCNERCSLDNGCLERGKLSQEACYFYERNEPRWRIFEANVTAI